jgi:hypothetical protein
MTPADIANQIKHELKNLRSQIDGQKHAIKRSVGKNQEVHDAESKLQALHTRLEVLTGNLAKLDPLAHPDAG